MLLSGVKPWMYVLFGSTKWLHLLLIFYPFAILISSKALLRGKAEAGVILDGTSLLSYFNFALRIVNLDCLLEFS